MAVPTVHESQRRERVVPTSHDITVQNSQDRVTVRSGNEYTCRVVPLNLDAPRSIEPYLVARPIVADGQLFIWQPGERIKPQVIENIVKNDARRAGLEGLSPPTLLHTCGKSVLDAGVDLVTIAARMGHDSVETTASYTHPSGRDPERAVEQLQTDP
jgi:site-specific recombinase XerD